MAMKFEFKMVPIDGMEDSTGEYGCRYLIDGKSVCGIDWFRIKMVADLQAVRNMLERIMIPIENEGNVIFPPR